MRHVSGRQPPHAAERSERLKKQRGAAIQAAEHVADLVSRLARGAEVLPGETDRAGHPPEALRAAAAELASAAARWAALRPGDTWAVDWPGRPRPARNDRRPRRRAG
jgi:hypothetical protein